MNIHIRASAAILALAITSWANAALTVVGSVGGAPSGVSKVNFDNLTPGTSGGVASGPSGGPVTVSSTLDGGVVIGEFPVGAPTLYAAPVLSGLNGTGFGAGGSVQPNGDDATPYLKTGTGTVTLNLPGPQQYLGILWGSVDPENTLQFYSGATLVGTVTGVDVAAAPNGDQGVQGTLYVNINSTLAFDRVVASSPGKVTFEFDNIAFSPAPVNCHCVYTQGYWKTHLEAWPVTSLTLGTVTYTQSQLLDILNQPVKGNGLVDLAHQLIAAKLNLAQSGACPAPTAVAAAIAAADALIGGAVIPPVGSASVPTSTTSGAVSILDDYNNGLAAGGPSHCD